MKRVFEIPKICAAELCAEDVMTGSELVKANTAKLGKAEDLTPVSNELWRGTDDNWID